MSEASSEGAVGTSEEGRVKGGASSSSSTSHSHSLLQKESSFAWSQGNDTDTGDRDSIQSDAPSYGTGALPSLGCWNEAGIQSAIEETKQLVLREDVDDAEFATLPDKVSPPHPNPLEAAAAAAAAIPSHARRLQRSVASSSTEGSTELFSFKTREKVTEAEAAHRSPSPTLFLRSRPSKSFSDTRAGESDRLSSMSQPGHCLSDIGPWPGQHSNDERASSTSQRTTSESWRSSDHSSWRSSDMLMLRQPANFSIPEDTETPSPAGAPVVITRVCSDSYTRRSSATAAPALWARSSSSVGHGSAPLRGALSAAAADEAHNLDDAQMRAHAVVYARAKSISVEEACAQLRLKCLRARRSTMPLDAERPGTSAAAAYRAECRST